MSLSEVQNELNQNTWDHQSLVKLLECVGQCGHVFKLETLAKCLAAFLNRELVARNLSGNFMFSKISPNRQIFGKISLYYIGAEGVN